MATPRPRVLIVDDQLAMAETLADGLAEHGYDAEACSSSRRALTLLEREPFDALITDLRMPDVDGLALLTASRRVAPERPVLVMTAYGAVDSAIASLRQGAAHYLTKPFRLEELVVFLGRALDEVRVRAEVNALGRELHARSHLLGQSEPMRAVLGIIQRVADTSAPVLLLGETGTGKGLVARTLHQESRRAPARLVTVNCAALPEALLESELFGHAKGAFTGATTARPGLFVEADGGTLFLDEIGEMPLAMQAKLLDALERGVVRALGSTRERAVDVRVIAATNQRLRERVQAGTFREDLFYRLEVLTIALPPLRDRRDDIPLLLERYLDEMRQRHPTSPVRRIAPAAMARLVGHAWPGNVRELVHLAERLVLLGQGPEITLADLPLELRAPSSPALPSPQPSSPSLARPDPGAFGIEPGIIPVRELQRRYAAWALKQLGGHRTRTAERLGVDAKTLARWLDGDGDGSAS